MNMKLLRILLAFITVIPSAHAQEEVRAPIEMVEHSDDDLVLVQLRIGRTALADGIQGYTTKSGLLLPLGQIAQALQLPIKVTAQEGKAEGWAINPDNRIIVDVARRQATIGGKRVSFSATQVEPHRDDIYVDTALLADWLEMDFDFSFTTQSVEVKPREGVKLPIQARAEREQVRNTIGRGDTRGAEGPFPRKEIPYQLATIPYTDLSYTGGYDKRAYSGVHNGGTALAGGDLFYMHSNIYASVDESFRDLRWTLSRRDPDGNILQSDDKLAGTKFGEALRDYEIREVQFGDISTQQLPLTAFNQQGRGALISNIPYDRATQYDRTTIQGNLQRGWEVELYRNDELLSFQRASANGRYEFVDVPLLSGTNIIRLVFYGPFGETREETQRFLVSDQLTKQGKSYFRTSVSQQNTNSFDVLSQNQILSLSGATPTQQEAVKGEPRAMFEYEYGLLDNISLFASAAHLTTSDSIEHNYLSAGTGATYGGAYGRFDYAHDVSEGGDAVKFLVQDSFGNVTVSAEHQQFFDFISEFTESGTDSVTRRTTARADAPLTLPYLPRLNNGITFTETVYDSDRKVDEYGYRLSTAINRLSVSHNLLHRTDTSPSPVSVIGIGGIPFTFITKDEQTTGELLISFPFRKFIMRGNMLYDIQPEKQLQTLLTSVEYGFARNTNAIFQVDHQFISDRLTNYTLGLNHDFEKFRVGANVSRDSNGDNTVGVTLSTSFGADPRSGKFQFYPDNSATSGLISARAYHDVNNNGSFDEGDKPLEEAKFLVNRGYTQQATDADGTVLLRNLQPDSRSSLTLDSKSIDNPYLMSQNAGIDVVTRPGVAAMVDFPVTGSGDIEGTVNILSLDEESKEAANVTLQLFDKNGKLVRETQTSYDGYYLLNGVPAGTYILRPSYDQANRLGLITPPDRKVIISSDETDSHIIDLDIIREPEDTHEEVSVDG
jgi:hypothetical protein